MDSPTRRIAAAAATINDSLLLSSHSKRRRSTSRRKSSNSSPEFEFWMVRNPSFPQPNLLSADELFVDGILLPLHKLHLQPPSNPPPAATAGNSHIINNNIIPSSSDSTPPEEAAHKSVGRTSTSKRWKDMFKKAALPSSSSTRQPLIKDKDKQRHKVVVVDKQQQKKRGVSNANSASPSELNINIWPFSRSRSAGNNVTLPKMFPTTRKVNSAPCSRSNSAGESKSRNKWPPSSPTRIIGGGVGVHLGRSSPVWQVRRNSGGGIKDSAGSNGKARVMKSLNVPICIGYGPHLSCRSDENGSSGGTRRNGGRYGGRRPKNSSSFHIGHGGGNLFNLRSLFAKRVH